MKNMSLKSKLFFLVGVLMFVGMAIGGVGYISLKKVESEYSNIAKINLPNIQNVEEMFVQARGIQIQALRLGVDGTTAEQDKEAIDGIKSSWEKLAEYEKSYLAIEFGPGEDAIYKDFRKNLDALNADTDKIVSLFNKNSDPKSAEYQEMSKITITGMRDSGNAVRESARKLIDYHNKSADESQADAIAAATNGTLFSVGILVAGMALGGLFAFFFTNSLVSTLLNISQSLSDSGAQVTSAAGQIAASSEELSQAATEQAASLEETAASVEEMTSMVNKTAENAKQSTEISGHSQSSATRGQEVVREMVDSMQAIDQSNTNIMQQVNQSNNQISEIVTVIQEIGNKTKVINDIVFQTKLLSFNASVEAARAGEHGKGFAVVAEEVGNLAQMSGNAAKEISSMLEGSIQKVESIVQHTKTNVERLLGEGKLKVEAGTRVAQQCGEVLNEIVGNVSKVSEMSSEISKASEEQARGVQEITKAMAQLDQTTQQNAATSEEAASAAEELSAQAESMKQIVDSLMQTVLGASGHNTPVVQQVPRAAARPVHHTGAKVVPLNAKKASASAAPMKKAAGDSHMPTYNDPRFEEV